MIDEFRAAFQELIDASVATDPGRFPPAVQRVYRLASQVPPAERELALEALGPFLGGGHTAPGITADLAVVAGALVEMGAAPGPAGAEVVRLLRGIGQGAAVFLHAWEQTGGGRPPEPDDVTAAEEERVAARLGETAPTATVCWWTVRRYGVAAKTMLSQAEVRSTVRADAELRAELVAVANQLSGALAEFAEIRALLRMAEATSALVLDRASGRGFRVLFDGIGDNFQLHTLLADALIGPEGRGLPGRRPDPRWTAAFRDAPPDPAARVVEGWWNLVALDGSWVWNEGVPADIPTVDGEHVLVLEEQPYPRSWNAGRRHPMVRGWLEVEEEIAAEEADAWWGRAAPAAARTPAEADPAAPGVAEPPQEPVPAPAPDTASGRDPTGAPARPAPTGGDGGPDAAGEGTGEFSEGGGAHTAGPAPGRPGDPAGAGPAAPPAAWPRADGGGAALRSDGGGQGAAAERPEEVRPGIGEGDSYPARPYTASSVSARAAGAGAPSAAGDAAGTGDADGRGGAEHRPGSEAAAGSPAAPLSGGEADAAPVRPDQEDGAAEPAPAPFGESPSGGSQGAPGPPGGSGGHGDGAPARPVPDGLPGGAAPVPIPDRTPPAEPEPGAPADPATRHEEPERLAEHSGEHAEEHRDAGGEGRDSGDSGDRGGGEGSGADSDDADSGEAAPSPGAPLLPPLPPGVSNSAGWGPTWL
ncbi:hypothetical protein [Streptomonospora sp. PA3]|uniref:hypothetical protein n=1 Tax=Streptomonospora sp. PA3 TaxID=2607326 RepID=UPI0031BB61DF